MRHHRFAVLGLAIVAVLAVSVSSAFAAGAPRIKSGGKFLTATETLTAKATSSTETLLRMPKLSLNLKSAAGNCNFEGTVRGSAAESPGTGEKGTLKCTGVAVEGAEALCTVKSTGKAAGEVVTNGLKGTLVWLGSTGEEAGFKFAPEEETFVRLLFEGAECSVAGEYPVTKEVIGKLLPVAKEVTEGELVFPTLPKASCLAEGTPSAILKWFNNASQRVEQTLGANQLAFQVMKAALCGTAKLKAFNAKGENVAVGVFSG